MSRVWTILRKENGEIANKKAIADLFNQLKDGKYLVEVNDHNKRSNPQNAYYFAAMVPLVQKGIRDLGTELTLAETHEFLKARFNLSGVVNPEIGEVIQVPRSTTALTKFEFSEYISKIQRFAAEFLNIIVPDPGEVLTMFE